MEKQYEVVIKEILLSTPDERGYISEVQTKEVYSQRFAALNVPSISNFLNKEINHE